ncbi:hypothetical protein VNO80_17484 [Phaseolus coccineus]|uniref:Uncharacterized protein n=1 Tax=Phaseolus coccineus TaxID=3886 RepID=A0AAN9R2X5_PHACN
MLMMLKNLTTSETDGTWIIECFKILSFIHVSASLEFSYCITLYQNLNVGLFLERESIQLSLIELVGVILTSKDSQLRITRTRKMSTNTTSSGARATTLRVTVALIAMALLLWTIHYGYQTTTALQKHPLHSQWISWVGAMIMISGFLLLALGFPIIVDLFLRLLEELQCPKETDIHQKLKLKVDQFCYN